MNAKCYGVHFCKRSDKERDRYHALYTHASQYTDTSKLVFPLFTAGETFISCAVTRSSQ
ncbi:hypothetical protein HBH56_184350 [Parastagonospora nodorum]|uniref:Uncharacterized protein n=1 Tax=Phaeosphaeria nodorum (strain SN15 / ATCC MYA-4574 / FGSC 10173) TaxID=321614 RepID=A0A7U2I6V7_PHANO|nr:hypothetical protein HBH56_184350 [Parastagonospora nodorum]QRD04070.1 hypothetical protein JI435_420650 [Parastagonospora nodorum SN15]KAH3926139.1 hypothetical protein HBH54_173500 [Parastagonospora nodorum]KAH3962473.1 hypothetical protein HBH52_224980 [Parastagonospora nodorum]KAH4047121.1 hypothetical protein HBH49_177740 [Parastagonospora nodorum]